MSDSKFTIHPTQSTGFLIVCNDDPGNALHLADLDDLLRLRIRLNSYIDTQVDDGPAQIAAPLAEIIDSARARELIQERGHDIRITTLVTACSRGTLRTAVKTNGRWTFQRWAFEEWYKGWLSRRHD